MYKKLFFIVLFFVILITYRYINRIVIRPLKVYKQPCFDVEHKPIILWDLHHVILQKDIPKIFHLIWSYNKKTELLSAFSFAMVKDICLACYYMLFSGFSAEILVVIAQKNHHQLLADLIIEISNTQYIDTDVALLIKELHKKGYRQRIFSNIGTTIFNDLLRKPDMNNFFNTGIFDLEKSQVFCYNYTNFTSIVRKPHDSFYQKYKKDVSQDLSSFVFIDDKYKNIYAAQQNGMYALQFHTIVRLQKELSFLLGICI